MRDRSGWQNGAMAEITLHDTPIQTVGELPEVGAPAPSFTLTGADMGDVSSDGYAGRPVVLNIFPSIDTPVCANSVRAFNQRAAEQEGVTVLCVSNDLPFALSRFCGAEGIEDVEVASGFRSSFGSDYGITMADGPLAGLMGRAVVVVDADGKVAHSQLVGEIGQEPDYDAALGAIA